MRLFARIVSTAVLLLLLAGCSERQQTFGVKDEKKRWEAEGWTYLETFGRPAEDSIQVADVHDDVDPDYTANAFARTDGVLTNREYTPTNRIYLIVNMQRPNGDTFSLVFTKPKP